MSGAGACGCGAGGCGGGCAGGCAPGPEAHAVAPAARFAQGAIRDRLVAALGRERALDRLSTRDPTDPALVLVDAWAGAMHVLAFSAARLAEDADLAIGADPGALLELTRLIGYAPRPAISSATLVAFTIDPATATLVVPSGMQIATIPRNSELPLAFETGADLTAKAVWNALLPARAVAVQAVTAATTQLLVAGTDVHAALGDVVLVRIDAATLLCARFVDVVRTPDLVAPRALLTVTAGVAVASAFGPALGEVAVLGVRSSAFGALAPDYDLIKPGTSDAATVRLLSPAPHVGGPALPAHSATTEEIFNSALAILSADEWPGLAMPANGTVDLSSVVKEALPGRAVLFAAGSHRRVGQVATITEAYRAGFALSAAVTRITLDGVATIPGQPDSFGNQVRDTAIHIETQRLRLLALPDPAEIVPSPAAPDRLMVAGSVALPAGRLIVLAGRYAATGARLAEPATVLSATPSGGGTLLTLTQRLQGRFLAEGLTIAANVAAASHGRTPPNQPELLGSSNARLPAPVYPLSTGPVAHVADSSARGYTPAIEVRVGGRLYRPVEQLFDLADDRAWRLRQRRGGGFEVQFAGRLPTAANSVTAHYRVGGGAAGNVDPGRVTMVMTPVLGVSQAENLTAAEGGMDAAGPDDMRRAGDTVAMLDRVVALADYERFARAFRGVGKALATDVHETLRRTVYLTIAGAGGQPPSASLADDLRSALAKVAIPGRRCKVVGYVEKRVGVLVAFAHDPALIRADVEAAVRAALLAAFGATARGFGQPLYRSELLAVTQAVPGVVAATATIAGGADPASARPPRVANGVLSPAELVSIGADTLVIAEMMA